jgi:hypothetical protein
MDHWTTKPGDFGNAQTVTQLLRAGLPVGVFFCSDHAELGALIAELLNRELELPKEEEKAESN